MPTDGERDRWVIASAKINLALHVTGRRDDGYHTLDSLVTFTETGDRLSFVEDDDLTVAVCGLFADSIDRNNNSVVDAANRLRSATGSKFGASVTLEKNLPVASGIGGGSADAAAALQGLGKLWQTQLGDSELAEMALELGADVPMCLAGRPARVSGIGEVIEPVALPSFPLVLVNPGTPLSTPDVFGALTKRDNTPIAMPHDATTAEGWLSALNRMRNDLAAPATKMVPAITQCLQALGEEPGCRLARMSGSGATCFGIFDTDERAEAAAHHIGDENASWWSVATRTLAGQGETKS